MSEGQEGLPVPDDMRAEPMNRARKALGLSYDQLARRLRVTKPTVYNWMTGRTVPRVPYHKDLRKVLYGKVPEHDHVLWLRHLGRLYKGTVYRIGGRGGHVRFTLRSGDPRTTYARPTQRPVYLGNTWAEAECRKRDLGTLKEAVEAARAGNVVLDDERFETQALANTIDRLAMGHVVNRGAFSAPEGLFR